MTEETIPNDGDAVFPEAQIRHSRWFGLVWAIPIAALMIVGYLGIQALMTRGIEVVVTFDNVTGAKVGDTKVIYKGTEVGHVTAININADHEHVDVTLRLDPHAKPFLTTNTRFWLVGENPNLDDISSVKAALAGLTIGVGPSTRGQPTRHFTGLSQPPAVMPDTPGTAYVLTCAHLGNVKTGSSLFYRGGEVGKVTNVRFADTNIFKIDIFVFSPFDKYVRPATAFWVSSPLHVGFDNNGLNADFQHPAAIFGGAIEVDREDDAGDAPTSAPGTVFPLYEYGGQAKAASAGPQVSYAFTFAGTTGGRLEAGAPVRLLGFRVGAVKSVHLIFDKATGTPRTAVIADLYPKRLNVQTPLNPQNARAWHDATNAVVTRLLKLGYRAMLIQEPPVVGNLVVSLDAVKGAHAAMLEAGNPLSIPTAEQSGGLEGAMGQLNQILAKVNAIPIEAIGRNVHDITSKVDQLVSSPEIGSSLKHLDSTLAQADEILAQAKPKIGPLIAKLNQAADDVAGTAAAARGILNGDDGKQDANLPAAIEQLTEAARSIRTLADYLDRHPEALIRGKGKD